MHKYVFDKLVWAKLLNQFLGEEWFCKSRVPHKGYQSHYK